MREALGGSGGSVQGQVSTSWSKRSSYVNPPFDPRINSILSTPGPFKSKLRHGILQQHDSILNNSGSPQKYPYALRFLWNPSNISHNISVQAENLAQYQLTADQAAATTIGTGSGSIGFKLLFDRTYEIAYGPQRGMPDLRKVGAYADVAFLERVMGSVSPSVDARGNQVFQPAQLLPVNFLFGGGDGHGGVVGLKYVGWITSASIVYTQFSENMVPQRCEIDLSVTLIIGQDDVSAGGGSLLERGANAPTLGNSPNNTSRRRQTL